MIDLAFRSATALLSALENKETSSEELLKHYLSRIERLGGTQSSRWMPIGRWPRPGAATRSGPASKGAALSTASR
jgi:hypothetical protein